MANKISLTEDEFNSILAEVERDLAVVLKSEDARLSKAFEDGDEPAPSDDGGGDEGGETSASAPAGEGSAPAPAPDAPPPGAEGSAPADPADPAADGGPMDVQALEAEYAQLPPEELKAHYMAAKAALLKLVGGGAGPDADMGAGPEASAPAPAAPPMAPEQSAPPPAMKAEVPAAKPAASSPGNGGKMAKSEVPLSKAEVEDLRLQVEGLSKALELIVATPQRKAITGLDYFRKSEGDAPEKKLLPRSEIMVKLGEVAKNPALSKSDRRLINQYSVGEVDASKIEHLLR